MREMYNVGMNTNKISLEVQIGTPGLAHSTAFLFSDEISYVMITESGNEDGNIAKTPIGTAEDLTQKFLMIRTSVDFRLMDPGQWPQLIENIYCKYILSGGAEEKAYHCDSDEKYISDEGNIVVIDKYIDLYQED